MKDYDAIAREIYNPSIFSTPEWNEAEIQRITAILRKHDEAEASVGRLTNRQIHERAAGYGLEDTFFICNKIDPDALEERRRSAPTDEKGLVGALEQYADARNWAADEDGAARIWLEPGSSTPTAYHGFELAKKVLLAREAPKDDEQEWLDENGYMPGNDDSLPKANEAPKEQA